MGINKTTWIKELTRLEKKPSEIVKILKKKGLIDNEKKALNYINVVRSKLKKENLMNLNNSVIFEQDNQKVFNYLHNESDLEDIANIVSDSKYVHVNTKLPALSNQSYFYIHQMLKSFVFNTYFNNPDMWAVVKSKEQLKLKLNIEIDWNNDKIYELFTKVRDRALNDQFYYSYDESIFDYSLSPVERKKLLQNKSLTNLSDIAKGEQTRRNKLIQDRTLIYNKFNTIRSKIHELNKNVEIKDGDEEFKGELIFNDDDLDIKNEFESKLQQKLNSLNNDFELKNKLQVKMDSLIEQMKEKDKEVVKITPDYILKEKSQVIDTQFDYKKTFSYKYLSKIAEKEKNNDLTEEIIQKYIENMYSRKITQNDPSFDINEKHSTQNINDFDDLKKFEEEFKIKIGMIQELNENYKLFKEILPKFKPELSKKYQKKMDQLKNKQNALLSENRLDSLRVYCDDVDEFVKKLVDSLANYQELSF